MRRFENSGGNGYILGCAVVLLLCGLSAVGFGYGLYELLELGQRHGVQPGAVILAAVLLLALFSLYQVHRNRR